MQWRRKRDVTGDGVFCRQDATELAFPPNLDNTSRKFIHEAVKRLGLTSKSYGKGAVLYAVFGFGAAVSMVLVVVVVLLL